jgi:hypothetical protein
MRERSRPTSLLSRRQLIQGAATLTASSLLPGCGSSSSPTAAMPMSQTIAFAPIASPVAYGAASMTLSATASSALAVTFAVVSGPATISGSTLTIVGIGNVVVSANQSGNSTYNAAPTVTQAVTVTNPNAQPAPATTTAASLVVAATSQGSVASGFAGLSYEKYHLYLRTFSASNASMIALFKLLGTSVLRIGGATTDEEVWAPDGPGQTSGQIAPSDIDSLSAFLKATGWQCLYAINLGGSAPGAPFPTTTALAAEEVAYVVKSLGSSLLGIEIGNEPDDYGSSYYAGQPWNLSTFETLWEQYRSAILATTPSAPITGPAVSVVSRLNSWTLPFGQFVSKSQITQLTQHYYRAEGQLPTSTAANLITPDTTLVSGLQTLLTGAQGIGVPYRISECNNYSNGGSPGVSDAYASTLWAIDFLYNCAQGGATGVNFHGGGDATGYTPIADNNGVVNGIRPEFYGILLFSLAGQGTLYQTTVVADGLNVTAYALLTPSGGINLIINNKDSTNNLQISVELPQSAHIGSLLQMAQLTTGASGPSLAGTTGVTIQGAAVNINGTFSPGPPYLVAINGTQLTCYVPALSAILLQLS